MPDSLLALPSSPQVVSVDSSLEAVSMESSNESPKVLKYWVVRDKWAILLLPCKAYITHWPFILCNISSPTPDFISFMIPYILLIPMGSFLYQALPLDWQEEQAFPVDAHYGTTCR